jgi:type I restriction enzyme R subunit
MTRPGEHKTVQRRILQYAEQVGWTFVSQGEAEARRGFTNGPTIESRAKDASLFFGDILYDRVTALNPSFVDPPHELARRLGAFPANIFGNRDFLRAIRGQLTFFETDEMRELNLRIIDFEVPSNNVFEVTEEFYSLTMAATARERI